MSFFPYFLLGTGILLGIVGWVYQRFALRKVSYARYFSEQRVFQGEQVEMIEEIANAKLLPLPWLRLESIITSGLIFGSQDNFGISAGDIYQNHVSLFYLRPYRRIKRRHLVECSRRGFFRLESVTLTTGDLIGLGRSTLTIPVHLELMVYPALLSYDELPLPVHSWLGELTVKRWVIPDPFVKAGTREYMAGDPLNLVNWKATARTGTLQVHKQDYTADTRLIICVNVEDSDAMWRSATDPARIERALSYAATVAEYATRHGMEVGLLMNGALEGSSMKEPVVLEQAGSLEDILSLLARLNLERSVPMSRLLELELTQGSRDNDYLIISCHRGPELEQAAARLAWNGNGVEWLDLPPLPEPGNEGRASA